jgi:hypothetical protein
VNVLSSSPPDPSEYDCHGQKAVLLPTGWADLPYAWHPDTIELGIYQIGELFLLGIYLVKNKCLCHHTYLLFFIFQKICLNYS